MVIFFFWFLSSSERALGRPVPHVFFDFKTKIVKPFRGQYTENAKRALFFFFFPLSSILSLSSSGKHLYGRRLRPRVSQRRRRRRRTL